MTKTEIANGALSHQGIPSIDDITDTTSDEAIECNAHYDISLKTLLREHPWSFARKEVALAVVTGETSEVWDYVYGYPADCFDIREIWNETTNDDPRIDYEIGTHSSGSSKVILTNQEDAILVYTKLITVENMYPSDFTTALELMLAWRTVMTLTRKADLKNQIGNNYLIALSKAKIADKGEQHKAFPEHDKYITARS